MVFKNSFDNMTPEETALLEKYFCGYNYEASSHTFIANYIWKDTHHITWEIIGKYLCLLGMGTLETEEKEYFMSFPLTRWGSYDLEELRYTIDTARARFAEEGIPFEISMIPESLAPLLTELYGDEVVISHDRDDDDYIYLREDLAELKGRKYHQKKNHLNYFLRTYDWSYEEITPDNLEEVREFLVRINGDKLEELPEEWRTILQLESQAIQLLLEFVGTGQLFTGLIRVDGKVEAVSIGEYSCPISKEAVFWSMWKRPIRQSGGSIRPSIKNSAAICRITSFMSTGKRIWEWRICGRPSSPISRSVWQKSTLQSGNREFEPFVNLFIIGQGVAFF